MASRPIPFRVRPDLEAIEQVIGHERRWLVRDPLTLAHFQLAEEEYSLLQMLDGRISAEELRAAFDAKFAPNRLNTSRLLYWTRKLYRDGLLLNFAEGEAERLLEQRRKQRQSELWGRLTNLLAIRFRGVDPDRFLNALHHLARPLFSVYSVMICIVLAVAALTLVLVHLDEVVGRLPDLNHVVKSSNLVCLWLVLAGTKVVHELAHGLACKHYGGECHEIGVMLLVFTPCLYCDVSDAWSIRSRWHRIAISAAGMCAEIVLASIATFLWWFSRPGLLNVVCLDMMLVCGISTLIFNANPLLRYDGYFILSDLVNVPNLWQRSRDTLWMALRRWFTYDGRPATDSLADGRTVWMVTYAIASTCYRWFVLVVILLFLLSALKPYGLQAIGQLVASVALLGTVLPLTKRMARTLTTPNSLNVRRGRAIIAIVVVVALGASCFIPLPYRVSAPIRLEPRGAQRLYVSVPGSIVSSFNIGDHIDKGQVVASLENSELQRELAELSGELSERQSRLATLEALRVDSPEASQKIPEARKALENAQQRLDQRQSDFSRLELRATRAGIVMAPPIVREDVSRQRELPSWSGVPLMESNRGAFLDIGTHVCLIGDLDAFDAIAYIDAEAIRFVEQSQRASVMLVNHPGVRISGQVHTIAATDVENVPQGMRHLIDGEPASAGASDIETRDTIYQVRLRLEKVDLQYIDGISGETRIQASPQSVFRRVQRYLSRTFTFELDV